MGLCTISRRSPCEFSDNLCSGRTVDGHSFDGKLEAWKENSAVGRDATMAENKAADVVDTQHRYGSRGGHDFVASKSVWPRKREFGHNQSSGTE